MYLVYPAIARDEYVVIYGVVGDFNDGHMTFAKYFMGEYEKFVFYRLYRVRKYVYSCTRSLRGSHKRL